MHKFLLHPVTLILLACALCASTASAKSFPGFTWKDMQDGQGLTSSGYTCFGYCPKVVRPPFEQALAGEPRAVAAFFDLALIVDGEYAEKQGRMILLVLAALGDRAFSNQLSQRSPWVRGLRAEDWTAVCKVTALG